MNDDDIEKLLQRLRAEVGPLAVDATYFSLLDKFLHLLVFTETDVQRDQLAADQGLRARLDAFRRSVPRSASLLTIAFQSRASFEPGTLWWTDGSCPVIDWGDQPDYNARLRELARPALAQRAAAWARKHWLVIAFFTSMLAVLLFGR